MPLCRQLIIGRIRWVMIHVQPPADDALELADSHLLRAAQLTLRHIVDDGPIGLTPSKALKRHFVTWAATAFDWPHYTAEDLFAINKVLNEHDFPPLMVLHDVLLSAKLVRHRKGFLHITKTGKKLLDHPGSLWVVLAEHMLLVIDHAEYTRYGDQLGSDWHLFLNLINMGMTEERFCTVLLGVDDNDYRLHSLVYVHVLRPLCWLGLLHESRHGEPYPTERVFTKTALWPVALTLDTDDDLAVPSLH